MRNRGPRPIAHQHRHQFHDLAAKQEIRRIERIGKKDLLLTGDEGRNQRQRRDQDDTD